MINKISNTQRNIKKEKERRKIKEACEVMDKINIHK